MDSQMERLKAQLAELQPAELARVEADVRAFIERHWEDLTDALSNMLEPHERIVMDLYYGSFGPKYTLTQLAKVMHISEAEVFAILRAIPTKYENLIAEIAAEDQEKALRPL